MSQREIVARSTATTPQVLALLATDDDSEVQSSVAMNARTPRDVVLRLLWKSKYDRVRYVSARHRSLTDSDLRDAAKDDYLARAIAARTDAPVDLLESLLVNGNYVVRKSVAGNRAMPAETAERLWVASGHDATIAEALAERKDVSEATLVALADPSWSVVASLRALAHPKTPVHVLVDVANGRTAADARTLSVVARNPNLPIDSAERLAAHRSVEVRVAVASTAALSDQTFRKLAADDYADVRAGVARSAHVAGDVLDALMRDNDRLVRRYAETEARSRIVDTWGVSDTNTEALDAILHTCPWWSDDATSQIDLLLTMFRNP